MNEEITNKMLFDVLMRIDGELVVLRMEVADLRTNTEVSLAALRKDMEEGLFTLRKDMEAGFARVDSEIADLRVDMTVLREDMVKLCTDMEAGFTRLGNEMSVLQGGMASLSQAFSDSTDFISETAGRFDDKTKRYVQKKIRTIQREHDVHEGRLVRLEKWAFPKG